MNRDDKKQGNRIREQTGQEYLDLLPGAMDALKDIIDNPTSNPAARVQAIGLLMDRGLGKPEETVNMTMKNADMEAAYAAVDRMVEEIRRSDMSERQ